MDKREFHNLVIPLTEKEMLYKHDATEARRFFSESSADQKYHPDDDGVLILSAPSTSSMTVYQTHGQLLPGQRQDFMGRPICFNKQTRFSVVPPHRHNYIEMSYVYTGSCTTIINNRELPLAEGDVIIMDSGVVHTILPTMDEDIVINCLMNKSYFTASFIERMQSGGAIPQFLSNALTESKDHNHYLLFHARQNPLIHELMENVFCEYQDPGLCTGEGIDSYMNLIFIELARCYQGDKEQEYKKERRSYPTEVLRYMDENCTTCSLEEVAARFGYHPNYLSRMIRQTIGMSFKNYITERRLARASFLLTNTDEPISQIALECGYTNQNFFYQKFKDQYGCTPAELRAR